MFYKRRDYSKIVDGRNPIIAHEFLGSDLKGKDVIIIDENNNRISEDGKVGENCVRGTALALGYY